MNVKLNLSICSALAVCLNAVSPNFTLKLLIGTRPLRQLMPISFVIFVQKLLCCIKPYTPPVLLVLFFKFEAICMF